LEDVLFILREKEQVWNIDPDEERKELVFPVLWGILNDFNARGFFFPKIGVEI
jgi:hypothetical protein